MLEHVAAALTALEAEGDFACELRCGSDALHLEVDGIGPIKLPIAQTTARKLSAAARPAPFGRGKQTLVDPKVRDTFEIPADQLRIDEGSWEPALASQLALIRQRLGLPETGGLEAVPDKLLVYGPGQFFVPHQDSERDDHMVGTLVVELPSTYTGGEMVVEHLGKKKTFKGAGRGRGELSFLAFYADCRHEVKPITSGYRVTLTYHLLQHPSGREREVPARSSTPGLAAAVKAYFSTPVVERYSREAPQLPDRLIYLLDHEYSEKSLGWDRLKGADRGRASALERVAAELDCEIFLTLADLHECWSCDEEDDWHHRRWGYHEDEDEDEDEKEGQGDYTLVDLIDSDLSLQHWIAPNGKVAPRMSLGASTDEVVSTLESDALVPFKLEHEGYMGNYGNTVDRWYHRAALVMWPRERSFVLRAKADPSWAVKEIGTLVKAKEVAQALARAGQLLPFWNQAARGETSTTFFPDVAAVAGALGKPELALELLSPLGEDRLNPRAMPALAKLTEQFGAPWGQRLFSAWSLRASYTRSAFWSRLPALVEALLAGETHGPLLARWLLSREIATFEQGQRGGFARLEHAERTVVKERADDLLAFLETARLLQASDLRDRLSAFLVAPATVPPLMVAAAWLQQIHAASPAISPGALGLAPLYQHVVHGVEGALAKEPRRADDWSITPPSGCACALCEKLSVFLLDRSQIEHRWPLAKEGRQHIHQRIDGHRLPVTHVTRREGSPHTLVLTKQKTLFTQAAALRARQVELLGWLKKQRRAFEGG